MWQTVNRVLSESLGSAEIKSKTEITSGDIHSAWHIYYGDKAIFIKCNTRELLSNFTAEADQLTLLARSQTVKVPKVYGVGSDRNYSFLLLEYLPLEPLDTTNAYYLGQQLAQLHQWSEQPQFGLDFDNDLATTPQPNVWERRWATFFAEQRIGWQLQLAAEKGITFGNIDEIVKFVYSQLQNHHPQPSLLHGNLWPNNCATSPTGPILFDPACYWGDRECDLATLALYPHLPVQHIYDGYQSIWPLPEDYLVRQPIYQFYYLLNHCNLFAGQQHLVIAQQALDALFKV